MIFLNALKNPGHLLLAALTGLISTAVFAETPVCWTNIGFSVDVTGKPTKAKPQDISPAGNNRVCYVQRRSLPIIDIQVDVSAGTAYDPKDKAGVASLTRQMMGKSTKALDEESLMIAYSETGAIFDGNTDWERSSFTLRTLSDAKARDRSIDLLASVLQQPNFVDSIFEREKKRIMAYLQEAEKAPGTVAGRAYYRAIYPNHPYGYAATMESVNKITLKDLEAFYQSYYRDGRATITLVGDLSLAEADRIAIHLLGIQKADQKQVLPAIARKIRPERLTIPTISRIKAPERIALELPTKQSHILMGMPLMVKGDPDFFTVAVANQILGGGGLLSRLMLEVREKQGLVYDIRSEISTATEPGPFTISLQVENEKAGQALALTQKIYQDFIEKGPTQEEVTRTKQYLISAQPLRVESNRSIMAITSVIAFYAIPKTWSDDYVHNIEKVTLPQIKEVLARRFGQAPMVTVVVGQQRVGKN